MDTHCFCSAAISARGTTEIIYNVLDEIEGKNFYPQDPDDGMYFLIYSLVLCVAQEQ